MPQVSVIIPNYNHASFLKQRIDSILNQTYQDFEVILLDDCSTDDSREIIESYRNNSRVNHIVYNDQNSGSTFKQWQKGIELAKTELIWVAESDDYADINFLATLVDKFKDETVSLAYCRTVVAGEDKRQNLYKWGEAIQPETWNSDHNFIGKEFINSFLKYRNVIPNASAVIFKKKYFIDIDEILKMRYAGDWLLWIKLASKGNVYFSCNSLNYYRQHNNTTRYVKLFNEEIRRIEEYFIVIREGCNNSGSVFKAFEKEYKWILDEWLDRIKVFGIKKTLMPPYPFLFLLRFYYNLLIFKI